MAGEAAESLWTQAPGATGPARLAETVTPSDSTKLDFVCRALWVGGAGNVAVLTAGGSSVTFVGVAAGTLIPIELQRVNSTNTTATSMVAIR